MTDLDGPRGAANRAGKRRWGCATPTQKKEEKEFRPWGKQVGDSLKRVRTQDLPVVFFGFFVCRSTEGRHSLGWPIMISAAF